MGFKFGYKNKTYFERFDIRTYVDEGFGPDDLILNIEIIDRESLFLVDFSNFIMDSSYNESEVVDYINMEIKPKIKTMLLVGDTHRLIFKTLYDKYGV